MAAEIKRLSEQRNQLQQMALGGQSRSGGRGKMIVLLQIMFFLALIHFIYESILAPSWRLSLRYRLFALRDELRALKADCGVRLDDEHFAYLQTSIDTMIAMLHRYDVAAIAASELQYRRDPEFRRRVDVRAKMLEDCTLPQAQSIRRRSVELIARATAVNSGMLCAPLYPFAVMGIGFSTAQKLLRKIAALSRRELESVAPERVGIAIG
jgi:hypothetical protein